MIKLVTAVLLILGAANMSCAERIAVADRGMPGARVVCSSHDPLMTRTADWCRDFLARRGYAVDRTASTNDSFAPVWSLETMEDCPAARSLGVDVSRLGSARADACILTVTRVGASARVSIVGRNPRGVRSGVARLVALMSERNGSLLVPETSEFRTPFFPIRRLMVAPTGRIVNGEYGTTYNSLPAEWARWSDTLWTNWSDERLRIYAEQLWLLGFNSIEVCEIRGYRGVFTDEQLKNEITPKIRVFAKACRDNGMQVSLFIWGQSIFKEGDNLCWNAPEERKRMQSEYRRLARTYGDLTDHVVVHVGDPGGCTRNGCDAYKVTQELAAFILAAAGLRGLRRSFV